MNAPFILGLALIAQAAPLSVSELLTNSDRFNGQRVTISGTMNNLRGSTWHRGTRRYTFDLGDGKGTIYIISFENPPCRSGAVYVTRTELARAGWRRGSTRRGDRTADSPARGPHPVRGGRRRSQEALRGDGRARPEGVRPPRAALGSLLHRATHSSDR